MRNEFNILCKALEVGFNHTAVNTGHLISSESLILFLVFLKGFVISLA